MSFTVQQCAEFLHHAKICARSGDPRAMGLKAASDEVNEAPTATSFQDLLNKLLNSGASFGDIFAKILAVYSIITGPGTWLDKVKSVFELFGKTPPAPGPVTVP